MQSYLKAEPDTWLLNLDPDKVNVHSPYVKARPQRLLSPFITAAKTCCMLLRGKQVLLTRLSTAYYILKYLLPSQLEERNISLLDIMKTTFPALHSWKLERWPKKIPFFFASFKVSIWKTPLLRKGNPPQPTLGKESIKLGHNSQAGADKIIS